MRDNAEVRDLRDLLALARKLRQLAGESAAESDCDLFLAAAAALEARAHWLAETLPGDRQDHPAPAGHRPIDLLV